MVSFTIMLCSLRDRNGAGSEYLVAERLTDCSGIPSLHGHANGDYDPKAAVWPGASVMSLCTPYILEALLENFPNDAVSQPRYLDCLGQRRSECPTQLPCGTFGMITAVTDRGDLRCSHKPRRRAAGINTFGLMLCSSDSRQRV